MIKAMGAFSDIDRHHTVVIYPSFGRRLDDRTWKLNVHGIVTEPGEIGLRKRVLLRAMQRVMRVSPEEFQSELCQSRLRSFTAAGETKRRIAIRIGLETYRLQNKSKRNGHFSGSVRLTDETLEHLAEIGSLRDGWLHFDVVLHPGDERQFSGRCLLVEPVGKSVISDIDDTIKHTEVTSRRRLLVNTFLNDFQSIRGMSEAYQQWAGRGAVFHYVSSSPWQLFDHLHEFSQAVGFPDGSVHLRAFRLRDHMLRRMLLIRRRGKATVIRSLLSTFPDRRFLLVGDSGELDPEIYAKAARRFPQQVSRIVIRELPQRPLRGERQDRLMRQVPEEKWRLFHDAEELLHAPLWEPPTPELLVP